MSPSEQDILPNLFTIGAAKCGTTSLHRYLDAHPEVSMSEPKEPALFSFAPWEERIRDYATMFAPGARIRGESSTRYSTFPVVQMVPERIAARCPDARFIYLVRDPVERVVADYVQGYARMSFHYTLTRALWDMDQPANPFVARSRYATQFEQWLEHFDRSRFLVIEQGDLRGRRSETLRKVLEFLDIDTTVPASIDDELNSTELKERMTPAAARLWFTFAPLTRRLPGRLAGYLSRSRLFPVEKVGKPALDDRDRERLAAVLKPEADRFRELTGMACSSWSV